MHRKIKKPVSHAATQPGNWYYPSLFLSAVSASTSSSNSCAKNRRATGKNAPLNRRKKTVAFLKKRHKIALRNIFYAVPSFHSVL